MKKNEHKKSKKINLRRIIVLAFLILFAIYLFVTIKGNYLQTLEVGSRFKEVFNQNLKYKLIVMGSLIIFLYITTYIVTKKIKKGLKEFFENEKKQMPKLPIKSICLIFSIFISILIGNSLTDKIISAINSTVFGQVDPAFGMDIGYFIFCKPLIETVILYLITLIIIYTIYIVAYYIIVFNRYFEEGVDREILKKGIFFKQIITNIVLLAIAGAVLILVKSQDVVLSNSLNLSNGTSLLGAGPVEVSIKVWGYRIFAVIVLLCTILSTYYFKKGIFKKIAIWLFIIPTYLVALFIVMLATNLIYVKSNEFDKEKYYIEKNIEFTKNAYNINIDEIEIENTGTITIEDIEKNSEVINNINLLNKNVVLSALNQYKTNLGYYTYITSKVRKI